MNFKYLIAIAILFSITTLKAQTWTGNINSDWNNSANWTGWPLNGDDILIDPINYTGASASPVISANSVFTPAGMIVQNGATLTVQANLTATKRIELFTNGTVLTVNSGTLFASGSGSQGRFIVSDGAAVIQNNGMVKANQRVIVELGGSYTLNNGTVNPIQELAIGDGNALGSSLFDMNGGTVTIGQGLGFENEAGLYYPTFDMSGGTLSIGGDISWLGEAPGAGTPRFIMSGGTATVNGSILNDPTTTVNLYMQLSGAADLTFSGPAITLINQTDSIKQSGNSTMTLSGNTTIQNPGVWYANGGTVVFNGASNLQGTGSYEFHKLTINATKTLNHISPSTISISGDMHNSGVFNANSNTVKFSGTGAQSINGNSLTSFRNLTLSNTSASGLTLNKGISVTGALQLMDGKLNSSATNLVTLHDNATSNSGSANSFVNGPLKKIGNDAFIFPIGKNNKWRRLAITAPAIASSEFTGEYFSASYPNLTPVNAPLQAITNIEYWKLDRSNSSDAVKPSFYWEDAQASAITTCTQIAIAHWNGASWDYIPSTSSGICTGNGAGTIQYNTASNNSGYFTFGYTGNITSQNITLCNGNSYAIGSNTYTTSGTYVDILSDVNNADSTVITNLTILAPIVTNQSISLCHGNVFTMGSNTYSISGNYSHTLTSVHGCDSIVNTALTIKSPVNVSVIQNGIVLSASNTSADSYQWINCSVNSAPLPGKTSQSFTATANGSYAVIVTQNGCSDTSVCMNITTVALSKHQPVKGSVYPNPNSGKILIQLESSETAQLTLTDITGRIMSMETISGIKYELDYTNRENGIYILEILQGENVLRIKLIKH